MPARTALSRDLIRTEGVALADEKGLVGLSMRALASRLGVEAMSLYHHVPNKEALLDAMVDAVFAEFHDPRPDREWTEEVRRRMDSARAAMKRHRWAIGLMDSRRSAGLETLRHHDAMLGCFRTAGFSLPLTGHAIALLDSHLYGFVTQEVSLPFQDGAELAEIGEEMLRAMPEELRHLREFAADYALLPGYSFGPEFDYGLELILDALTRRLAEERAR